ADFASGVVDTDLSSVSGSDDTLASAKAIKSYVDSAVTAAQQGIAWKAPVRAATTTAATLASDFEDGDTLDGVTLATDDRILVKDQADETENGIYIVAASGAP